jgi:hypothetical protein
MPPGALFLYPSREGGGVMLEGRPTLEGELTLEGNRRLRGN